MSTEVAIDATPGSITVPVSKSADLITKFLKARLVPMIKGSPGIGKSQIVHEVAKAFGLKVIDLRLAQCDPVDLMGFPAIDPVTGKAKYAPMDTFPVVGDEIPKGYNGWLLFLDELNSAPTTVQAAAYKIILDRMVGQYHLHKNVAIVGAGNLDTDGAITNELSSALKSRLVHLTVTTNLNDWQPWAIANGIDSRIISYLNWRPANLHNFRPDLPGDTYACPRTWAFMNQLLPHIVADSSNQDSLAMATGVVGSGVALEFLSFCGIHQNLPKLSEILAAPKLVTVPSDPSIVWALCGALSEGVTEKNCDTLMDYIVRLDVEFQIVFIRLAMARTKQAIVSQKSIVEWVKVNGKELFS